MVVDESKNDRVEPHRPPIDPGLETGANQQASGTATLSGVPTGGLKDATAPAGNTPVAWNAIPVRGSRPHYNPLQGEFPLRPPRLVSLAT